MKTSINLYISFKIDTSEFIIPEGNEQVKVAANLLALEAIKSVTEVIFPIAAGAMAFNGTGFTLALIQKKLDEINEKMDTLLDVHQKSAKDFLTTAIIAVKVIYIRLATISCLLVETHFCLCNLLWWPQ